MSNEDFANFLSSSAGRRRPALVQGPLTNRFAEGLNSFLQAAKAKARICSTTRNLITIVYPINCPSTRLRRPTR